MHLQEEELNLFGVNIGGPISSDDDSVAVVVPDTVNPLPPHYFQVLQQEIKPLEATWDSLPELYVAARTFLHMYHED